MDSQNVLIFLSCLIIVSNSQVDTHKKLYENYKKTFSRISGLNQNLDNFINNHKLIASLNEKFKGVKFTENKFSAYSIADLQRLSGSVISENLTPRLGLIVSNTTNSTSSRASSTLRPLNTTTSLATTTRLNTTTSRAPNGTLTTIRLNSTTARLNTTTSRAPNGTLTTIRLNSTTARLNTTTSRAPNGTLTTIRLNSTTARLNTTTSRAPNGALTTIRLNSTTTIRPTTRLNITTTTIRMNTTTTTRSNITTVRPSTASSSNVSSIDWRKFGFVTRVKDQFTCGACWAFAATAAVESHLLKYKNMSFDLSEQNLIDCVTKNRGCIRGSPEFAFEYMKNGIMNETQYPYKVAQGNCSFTTPVVKISGMSAKTTTERDLEKDLIEKGPVVTLIEASNAWFFYSSGVLPSSGCTSGIINHAVLVVGFNNTASPPYWIIKNSWGWEWGMNGYMLIQKGVNACQIGKTNQYPLL